VEKPRSDTESENTRNCTFESRKNFMSFASFKAGVNLPFTNKESDRIPDCLTREFNHSSCYSVADATAKE
jgi:hypothetical protein